jgi:shikimate kinase
MVRASLKNNEQPHAVFLIGFMGAGKSTVGQHLARHKGWRFTDLDRLIEEQEGRTIAAIFQKSGEAVFRKLETEHLQRLLAEPRSPLPHIVALGGGAYAREENARMIRAAGGVVIFLDAPMEELLRRCRAELNAHVRPNLQDEKIFRRLYEERMAHYARANVRIDTMGRQVEEVAHEVEQWLRKANILWEES